MIGNFFNRFFLKIQISEKKRKNRENAIFAVNFKWPQNRFYSTYRPLQKTKMKVLSPSFQQNFQIKLIGGLHRFKEPKKNVIGNNYSKNSQKSALRSLLTYTHTHRFIYICVCVCAFVTIHTNSQHITCIYIRT